LIPNSTPTGVAMRRLAVLAFLFFGVAFAAVDYGVIDLPFDLSAPKSVDAPAPGQAAKSEKPGDNNPVPDVSAALSPPPAGGPPTGSVSLDISRISPNGSSVFAGQAKPNTYVTVLEAGKPVGSVKADANGEWSLVTEHRFASLEPNLSFETGTEPPKQVATAQPAPEKSKASTAPAVTAELMKKLEGMVSQAREEAKAESAKKEADAAAPPSSTTSTPAPPASPLSAATASQAPSAPAAPASPPAVAATTASPVYTPPGQTSSTVTASTGDNDVAAIPLPIMFVYDEAEFTSEGRRAATLLLEYLQLKRLNSISLTGHADERGSGPFNMDLSRERLDAVANFLREGGYAGKLDLIPKGETEPYAGIDRNKYAESDLFQLDRRVELRVVR
jgi:outer membrane protein OmpA-like peptidoglycan-associated protein